MKKIMFNDRFGLTDAVLKGRKTVTRRAISPQKAITSENIGYSALTPDNHVEIRGYHENGKYGSSFFKKPYAVGEIVAVAQSYEAAMNYIPYYGDWAMANDINRGLKGYFNKMFVKADLMPYKIRITDIRAERLQDITDDDCLTEGIWKANNIGLSGVTYWYSGLTNSTHRTPREAFASLIDKISGKGTWERNPYVWRIEFELIHN